MVLNTIRIVNSASFFIALPPTEGLTTCTYRVGEQGRRSNFSRQTGLVATLLGIAAAVRLATGCSQRVEESPSQSLTAPQQRSAGVLADASSEDREDLFRVEEAPIWGGEVPKNATVVYIDRDAVSVGHRKIQSSGADWLNRLRPLLNAPCTLLLSSPPEIYLVDAGPVFRALQSIGCEVWLKHPEAPVAFKVLLRDESEFDRWLAEPQPGKIRVIQRADGFELQTSAGKMAGPDANGPTVPTRSGQLDIGRLRRSLFRLKERLSRPSDACLVPSFGTELWSIAKALSGYYRGPGKPLFDQLCLVYPG
jgi:hypothetical protein